MSSYSRLAHATVPALVPDTDPRAQPSAGRQGRSPWLALGCAMVALAWAPGHALASSHGAHGSHGDHAHHGGHAAAAPVGSAVKVEGAWLRPAVAGQKATGGYMRLTASTDLMLLGFSSTVAAETQLHEMTMAGDVMQMRESGPIALPAGQAVALQPGAGQRHLMLMGLKRPLKAGDKVAVVLNLKSSDGKTFTQRVTVPVSARAPGSSVGGGAGAGAAAADPHAGHHH